MHTGPSRRSRRRLRPRHGRLRSGGLRIAPAGLFRRVWRPARSAGGSATPSRKSTSTASTAVIPRTRSDAARIIRSSIRVIFFCVWNGCVWNDGSLFAEPVERAADRGGLGIVLPDAAERGADDPAARVDAEYGADVRGSGAGGEQRREFVGVDPQRERDALPGGLPPDLAVVVAVQSPGFAAVLEAECEGLPRRCRRRRGRPPADRPPRPRGTPTARLRAGGASRRSARCGV